MRFKTNIKEIAVFSMLGAMMYASKLVMDFLPNIHLIGVFVVAITLVYRVKALYPIYIFVFLTGMFSGFGYWWIAYLYIWTILWFFIMLIPKRTPKKLLAVLCIALCGLHGFLYGVFFAPVQALIFDLSFEATLTWIAAGFGFDMIHGISNLLCGVMIMPIAAVLKRCEALTSK